ncbi:uncharacterized protein LOC8024264 [Ixodes scapularis]|uniref:uncharacterized protein LOC8024264 n=1 Tax=Ixodes scapularis TaxID=6945 RepID=UPI001AD74393|nr:uncharacterized protein LOC8024264 [Ixodes scapularis]
MPSSDEDQPDSHADVPFVINADGVGVVQSNTCNPSGEPQGLFKQFALLLLKWKEGKRLPSATLQEISSDVVLYIQSFAEHFLAPSASGNDQEKLKLFLERDLQKLVNEREREKYWKSCLSFVQPENVCLGRDMGGKVEAFTYVPVLKVLEHSLNKLSVDLSSRRSARSGEFLVDVFDGTAFQEHAYFQGDAKKICIQLHTDEFEVCDPLGSKRGRHKMMAVYYTVLNAPVDTRSKLSSIHLAVLAKEKLVIKYGLKKVLEPLVNDIARLETVGIVVNGEVLNGSVFFVTGDNLSLHRLGGFKCSFSQGRICRHCMALRQEISRKHRPSDFAERTPTVHDHHLSLLTCGVSSLSLYGVRSECAVAFSGFHPTQHLPPDIMHDLHEGVIPFLLKQVISSLVKDGVFSLEVLNAAIVRYPYSENDKRNKPEAVSMAMLQKTKTIKGNASQLFCLFRYLSFYVGECVPREQKVWGLYLLLRKIVYVIMSRRVTVEHIAYLERLILCFCVDFRETFPSVAVPCKLHFMIHYPKYRQMYGPLVRLWAMRYEWKHQYFKELSRKLRNFKNITSTLATRHQGHEMYLQSCEDSSTTMSTTGCKPVLFEHLPSDVKHHISENNISRENIFSLMLVSLDGTEYAVGSIIVTDISSEQPTFVLVCNIFSVSRCILTFVQKLETVKFDQHFHAYIVRRCPESLLLRDITNYQADALTIHTIGNKCFVSARHALI